MVAPFTEHDSLFSYQRRVLPILLGWGAANAVAGVRWWRGRDPWWRGVGIQCAPWGAIDALIALIGLRGATRKAAALAGGTLSEEAHAEEARKFERILWINGGLDVLYLVGGAFFLRRNAAHPERRGMAAGVIAQALFLFLFDLVNAVIVRVRRSR